jgi:hypothetical protein
VVQTSSYNEKAVVHRSCLTSGGIGLHHPMKKIQNYADAFDPGTLIMIETVMIWRKGGLRAEASSDTIRRQDDTHTGPNRMIGKAWRLVDTATQHTQDLPDKSTGAWLEDLLAAKG